MIAKNEGRVRKILVNEECSRPDLNWHSLWPGDFKSPVSTDSTTGASECCIVFSMEMSKNTHDDRAMQNYAAASTRPAVVRYDADCSLCRSLADFMAKRVPSDQIVFAASIENRPANLEVEVAEGGARRTLVGTEAWQWLLEHHPTLEEMNWIAQKLGMAVVASRSMMRGADVLRRLCFRCRK
jgi:predicted DCC family thiol-disulfide oxidoreductase YuxK